VASRFRALLARSNMVGIPKDALFSLVRLFRNVNTRKGEVDILVRLSHGAAFIFFLWCIPDNVATPRGLGHCFPVTRRTANNLAAIRGM